MNIKNSIECWCSETDDILEKLSDLPTNDVSVRRSERHYNIITVRTGLINWIRIIHRLRKLRRERQIFTQLYVCVR